MDLQLPELGWRIFGIAYGSGFNALMHGGLFIKPTLRMAAVVDSFFNATAFQSAVDGIRPCGAPEDNLLVHNCDKAAAGRFAQASDSWTALNAGQIPDAQIMTAAPAGDVALSGGSRRSRICLAERTSLTEGRDTTAAKGDPAKHALWGKEKQRSE